MTADPPACTLAVLGFTLTTANGPAAIVNRVLADFLSPNVAMTVAVPARSPGVTLPDPSIVALAFPELVMDQVTPEQGAALW